MPHIPTCDDLCLGVKWPNDTKSIQGVPATCTCQCHWVDRDGLRAFVVKRRP